MTQHESPPATDPDGSAVADDAALKSRHRAMWAMGDYASVADDLLVETLGPRLVEAAGVTAGEQVLDVAAGSGAAAIHAARVGADVVASDLTPELLQAGRVRAEAREISLRWEVADAEALPYPDASFDVVLSSFGVMFAPHHQEAADEMARVCRPGGRIALLSWTPAGFIGRMLATVKPYVGPPPPGASPPPLWGDEDHVRDLLGGRFTDVSAERADLEVGEFADGADFRDYFKARYGPVMAAYRGLGGDLDAEQALDAALAALADDALAGDPPRMGWEYLLLTATRT